MVSESGAGALLGWCLRRHWRLLAAAVAGGTLFQLATVVFPLCVRYAIDLGIQRGDLAVTARWAGAVVVVACGVVVGLALMQWQVTEAAARTTNELREELLDHALRLDRRGLARFGRGDLATRGTRDVELIYTWLAGFASMVTGCVGFAVILTLVAAQDSMLAVVGLATVPLLVALNVVLPRRFAAANARLSGAHGDRADAVEELLAASAAVRGIGGEGLLVRRHAPRSARVTDETITTARVAASWAASGPFVPGAATAVGLLVGGQAVIAGSLTVGGLVAFASWMTMLGVWVGVLTGRFTQLGEAFVAARRIRQVLRAEPALTSPAAPVPLPDGATLAATGVEHGSVLGPVDLRAAPGELVVVTGPLSSGKSTLLRLLGRWDDPDAGTVRHGTVDLRTAALDDVRARFALVPQRPQVVSGTVADNLRLGRPGPTDGELRAACAAAAIDDYLETLPDGYDTEVGERGTTLSGGQLQRLALARALLHGADVLLLDDLTSAVDAATERRMLAGLRSWLDAGPARRVVVFASHRDAVLAGADRVVRLPAPARTAPHDAGVPSAVCGGAGA